MTPMLHSYNTLPNELFSKANLNDFPDSRIIHWNKTLAAELFNGEQRITWESFFKNCSQYESAIAQAYSGHQFGHFSPILGDGRAALIGEVVDTNSNRKDIVAKGSGRTEYSRRGDGKATLYSVLREYIVSEAMFHLRVPTARSLAAYSTGESVYRYSEEPGGIILRVASSHIRIGTFEFLASRGLTAQLQELFEYTLERHFPEVEGEPNQKILGFLKQVGQKQSQMVGEWIRVGFIHGVMNTDNMSICGETIDFGPCAFLEEFSRDKVFSSIDRNGRYSFFSQMEIAKWNLCRLAECFIPLIQGDAQKILGEYLQDLFPEYDLIQHKVLSRKIGIDPNHKDAQSLVESWLNILEGNGLDYTNTHLWLLDEPDKVASSEEYKSFLNKRNSALINEFAQSMRQCNPVIIPRNHNVEEAINLGSQGDQNLVERMGKILSRPYTIQDDAADYLKPATPENRVTETFCGT